MLLDCPAHEFHDHQPHTVCRCSFNRAPARRRLALVHVSEPCFAGCLSKGVLEGEFGMRVLVTGAAGFIGSHVCEALLAQGHDVTGLDAFVPYYPRAVKERNLTNLRNVGGFRFSETDLRSDPLDHLLDGVDAVIHEAAMPGLVRSWDEFETYMSCNLLAVQRLLNASRNAGISRFIQVSTSSVYGAYAVGDELQPTRPTSPYGVTKLAAEQLVLAYVQEFGFPASILRYFSVYGPRQRPDMAYTIFIQSMLEGRPITLYGDGTQSRSNTYVADCVQGTLQAMSLARTGEIYNIGGGAEIELRRALEIIADAMQVEPEVRFEPRRRGDQLRTVADFSKAREHFGYQPLVQPEEGLLEQVRWLMQSASVVAAV